MENPKKVLILTAPFGSGHLQVSSSLTEEFLKHNNVVVDALLRIKLCSS